MRRRTVSSFFSALALVLATAPAARTAPGDLDPTFGGDGVVRTDLTPAEDYGFAVTIQPDGKIVSAARTPASRSSGTRPTAPWIHPSAAATGG